jgi:hypothetical protein
VRRGAKVGSCNALIILASFSLYVIFFTGTAPPLAPPLGAPAAGAPPLLSALGGIVFCPTSVPLCAFRGVLSRLQLCNFLIWVCKFRRGGFFHLERAHNHLCLARFWEQERLTHTSARTPCFFFESEMATAETEVETEPRSATYKTKKSAKIRPKTCFISLCTFELSAPCFLAHGEDEHQHQPKTGWLAVQAHTSARVNEHAHHTRAHRTVQSTTLPHAPVNQ